MERARGSRSPVREGSKVVEAARHVVLVGMMGSGKTTVGRHVAELLEWPFFDSDEVVAGRAERSVREIFESEGEHAFRRLESEVMADLLEASPPSVIAAGGGAVLDEDTRLRLTRRAQVVWLRARPEELERRLGHAGRHRPLLDGDPARLPVVLTELSARRAPIYASVAGHVIDVDDAGSPQRVAGAVLEALK